MEMWQLFQQGGGIAVALFVIAGVARAILKGDLVLGREYQDVLKRLDTTSKVAQELAEKQEDIADRERTQLTARIETQARRIDELTHTIRARGGGGR